MIATVIQPAATSIESISDILYDESEFDRTKDKATFRQFEDACDRVKKFYAQQHTLQTPYYLELIDEYFPTKVLRW
ncbi:hypothetical protein DTO164E3_5769 [Paecilomyces variotii]|nr:hypothetical protein DTO164E3_5769 [Paecilomyces variotii]KAJ9271993.1 hypothetical protein DTO212C5_2074 [Paecilomyces variotii]KAJ9410043.1 hypothetical protein DTO045G8_2036 [Paecilomyces variotii]